MAREDESSMQRVGAPCAYLFDGSLEGLLSAVFLAYERRETPDEIVPESRYQARFGQEALTVAVDYERALRVRRGVERAAGNQAFWAIMNAAACDNYDTGIIVYRFIRTCMARPRAQRANPVLEDLANPAVADLVALSKRATNECEHVRQFVRFSHLENGVWFARCNPNASVVPLVMGHFTARFNDQPFVIYDENHHIAGVYDGKRSTLMKGDAVPTAAATAHDADMKRAWKVFYDALSVQARHHPELRRQFMPVRLWKNLPEMQPAVPESETSIRPS